MDDQIVPISCQYAESRCSYYGEYAHSDFKIMKEVTANLADQILRYVFGGIMDFLFSAERIF